MADTCFRTIKVVYLMVVLSCLADANDRVVLCTDLSTKARHRQVGVGRVVASGNLGGVV